jgi:hypothetical protein
VLTLTEEQRYLAEQLAEAQGASVEGFSGTGKTQVVAAFAKAMPSKRSAIRRSPSGTSGALGRMVSTSSTT